MLSQVKTVETLSNLAKFFARTVCGPFNQDISFMLVGKKGTGKSKAGLSLNCMAAYEIAMIRDNDPAKWKDYFNIDLIAIIDPIAAMDLIALPGKFLVKQFDDIGLGWNSRDFAKQDNKDKNDIFQINRVDNTVQTFTLPDQFLIDKVPRSLVSHYGEMDRKRRGFSRGFSVMKFFEPVTLFREGKQITPYLSVAGQKFVQYLIPRPPKRLEEEYDKRRDAITQKIRAAKAERMRENAGVEVPIRQNNSGSYTQPKRISKYQPAVVEALKGEKKLIQVAADYKLNYSYLRDLVAQERRAQNRSR